MKKLIYIVLLYFFTSQVMAQGVATDTTHYLLAGNLDDYSAWSFSKQTGTSGTLSNYHGINGNGLQIRYTFPPSGGWVNLEIPIGSSFTQSNPMVFFIYSTNSSDKIEIKFTDQDGSLFDVKPSLAKYSGGWNHVTAYLNNTTYDWGGNPTFDTPSKFSLAISGIALSSGTVFFDEIGIGKTGLLSSFQPTIDPDSQLVGAGFAQRRDLGVQPEDPLVLKYLEALQDQSTTDGNLLPNYSLQLTVFPNPFTTSLSINYKAGINSPIAVNIFNSDGIKVKTIENKDVSDGNYSLNWDGKDAEGKKVNPGVYLVQLVSGKHIESARVLYLKE